MKSRLQMEKNALITALTTLGVLTIGWMFKKVIDWVK